MSKYFSLIFFIFVFVPFSKGQRINKSQELKEFAQRSQQLFKTQKNEAEKKYFEKKLPIKSEENAETPYEIFSYRNLRPHYIAIHNAGGAEFIRSSDLYSGGSADLELSGAGITLGIWDQSRVRAEHQELVGRVTQIDGATLNSNHATHVAGTLMASGVDSLAKGMSYDAYLHAHDWFYDNTEMATAALNVLHVSQLHTVIYRDGIGEIFQVAVMPGIGLVILILTTRRIFTSDTKIRQRQNGILLCILLPIIS